MTEQNAHDDERDTADLAAGDTADLAIDDATDLVAADTARPQTPAEQLTPAGRAARRLAGCGGSPASPVP